MHSKRLFFILFFSSLLSLNCQKEKSSSAPGITAEDSIAKKDSLLSFPTRDDSSHSALFPESEPIPFPEMIRIDIEVVAASESLLLSKAETRAVGAISTAIHSLSDSLTEVLTHSLSEEDAQQLREYFTVSPVMHFGNVRSGNHSGTAFTYSFAASPKTEWKGITNEKNGVKGHLHVSFPFSLVASAYLTRLKGTPHLNQKLHRHPLVLTLEKASPPVS